MTIESVHHTGFFWSLWLPLFWITKEEEGVELNGAALDMITPPFSPILESWANTWYQLMKMPQGKMLQEKLNELIPKSITIVASKPL